MNLGIETEIHNNFRICRVKADGTEEQIGYAENIVLDRFYTHVLFGSEFINSLRLGTGTGELEATRTGLFSQKLVVANPTDTMEFAIPTSTRTAEFTVAANQGVGMNFSEIGLGSSNYLFTHALIEDSEGNPITISKTDLEVLKIYATIYLTVPEYLPTGVRYRTPLRENGLLLRGLGYGGTLQRVSLYDAEMAGDFPDSSVYTETYSTASALDGVMGVNFTYRLPMDNYNDRTIRTIVLGNSLVVNVREYTAFNGLDYAKQPVGVGDGKTRAFHMPAKDIDLSKELNIYVDGVLQDPSTYTFMEERNSAMRRQISKNLLGITRTPDNPFETLAGGVDHIFFNAGKMYRRLTGKDATGAEDSTIQEYRVYDVDRQTADVTEIARHTYQGRWRGDISGGGMNFLREDTMVMGDNAVFRIDPETGTLLQQFTNGAELAALVGTTLTGDYWFKESPWCTGTIKHAFGKWYTMRLRNVSGVMNWGTAEQRNLAETNRMLVTIDFENCTVGDQVAFLQTPYLYHTPTLLGRVAGTNLLVFYGDTLVHQPEYHFLEIDEDTGVHSDEWAFVQSGVSYWWPVRDPYTRDIVYFLCHKRLSANASSVGLAVYNQTTGRFDVRTVADPPSLPTTFSAGINFLPDSHAVYLDVYGDGIDAVQMVHKYSNYFTHYQVAVDRKNLELVNYPANSLGITIGGRYQAYNTIFVATPDEGFIMAFGDAPSGTEYNSAAHYSIQDWHFRARMPELVFNNPPPLGASISADYTTVFIPKTDQIVIDFTHTVTR